jgi:hypothetical protein
MADQQEKITKATKDAEQADANADHGAPQTPTAEEAAAAEQNDVSPETRESYQEYVDRAKDAPGEGRIP